VVKEVTKKVWVSDDGGTEFFCRENAVEFELRRKLAKFFEPYASFGQIDVQDAVDAVVKNFEELRTLVANSE
jgi:hypothetical protein